MAGESNDFGGSYRYGAEHDVFYGGSQLEATAVPTRLANVLIVIGLTMVAVAIFFLPVAVFDSDVGSGDVAYSELELESGDSPALTEFIHLGVTRWIGLVLALSCFAVCAWRISGNTVTLASTVCGLTGALYFGVGALLVRAEVLDAGFLGASLDVGLGVWVVLAGAAVAAAGSIYGYAKRPREAADITTAMAPPPP